MNKASLIKALDESELMVLFTKKDGTTRYMRATRSEDLIPADKRPKTAPEVDEDCDNIKVFDLDINEWRSFNFSSLVKM